MAEEVLESDVLVVGAGPAGLAVGACLRRARMDFRLLEKERQLAPSWRRHYRRLHLHTDRAHSSLPHLPLPRHYPRYPSRQQVVDYLDAYARAFELVPRLGEEVVVARRAVGGWEVETVASGDGAGRSRRYRARALVLATGSCAVPVRPRWPGQEDFTGKVLHSSQYLDGEPFRGQEVLVVGLGNSGGEIAMDLVEHGARPALSVRGPVNLLPRELLGLPLLTWALALSRLPPRLADALAAPLVRAALGDPGRFGLRRPEAGPMRQIRERGRIPLIDVGTLALIRQGRITVRPAVERFTQEGVVFTDGSSARCDSVVLATGYTHGLGFVKDAEALFDTDGRPRASGCESALPGLYLCGFFVAPTGMLREIAREARRIAAELARSG